MPKKITAVAFLFFVCSVLSACDRRSSLGPEDVLKNYLDASLKGRYEEAYTYVSAADKAAKDLQAYLRENEENKKLFSEAFIQKVSFKILKLEKTDAKALAHVEITMPDTGLGSRRETAESLAQKFKSGNVSLKTKTETFQLVKAKDGWKVFLDWETEKVKRENQAKVMNLLNEAKALEKSGNYQGALERYEQILTLDHINLDAVVGINEMKKKIRASASKP